MLSGFRVTITSVLQAIFSCFSTDFFIILTQPEFQIKGSFAGSSFFLHLLFHCWYSLIENLPSAAFHSLLLGDLRHSQGLSNIYVPESMPLASCLPPEC